MTYTANLNNNWQITIASRGIQTSINSIVSSPAQQQSQGTSFTMGNWTTPPQLFQTASSYVLQIDSDTGRHFIEIQANRINTLTTAPSLSNATPVKLELISEPTTDLHTVEFEPMPPMQMGNMSMSMNPMSMRMGNMSLNMGEGLKSASVKRFCTQCGREAKVNDRFCSSCGYELNY